MLLFRAKPSKSTFDIALNSSRRSTEHLKILPSIDSRVSKLKTQTTWKIQQQTTQHLETWPLTNTDAGQYTTQQLLWLRQATYWRTVLLDSTLKSQQYPKDIKCADQINKCQTKLNTAEQLKLQQNASSCTRHICGTKKPKNFEQSNRRQMQHNSKNVE